MFPPMVIVRTDPALSTCSSLDEASHTPIDGVPYAWGGGRNRKLAEYGVSPIATSYFGFHPFGDVARICTGTPLTFSFPELSEDVREDFEITNLNLEEYRVTDFSGANGINGENGIRRGLPRLH